MEANASAAPPEVRLSELLPKKCAIVSHIETGGEDIQRLKALGVCIGRRIEVIKQGDPLIIRVFSSRSGYIGLARGAGVAWGLYTGPLRDAETAPQMKDAAGIEAEPPPSPAQNPRHAFTLALVGNPNAGKTTLFNALTGLRAKTANFPGTTIERRVGRVQIGRRQMVIVDLPGLYSLESSFAGGKTGERRTARSPRKTRRPGRRAGRCGCDKS